MSHLVPNILSGIFENADLLHRNGNRDFFVLLWVPDKMLFGSKNTELEKFYELFENYGFQNYSIIENNAQFIKTLYSIDSGLDKLIVHSDFYLYKRPSLFMLFLILRGRKFLGKVVKIEWGPKKIQLSLKKKIRYYIDKYAYSHFYCVVNLTKEDIIITKEKFPKANTVEVSYLLGTPNFPETHNKHLKDIESCKIMISHSGHKHNLHLRSFHLLEKFSNENILIVCPLCYGPEEYIKDVIKEGKKLFGDKFTYFTELKPLEEYLLLIKSMHIYITAAEIQTGIFAAATSLANGLKVYLGANLFNHYIDKGFILKRIEDLKKNNYTEFIQPLDLITVTENRNLSDSIERKENNIKIWKQIYEGKL